MLVRFARIVNHDIRFWLVRERRRAAMIEDMGSALVALHSQYNLPYPDEMPNYTIDYKSPLQQYGYWKDNPSPVSSPRSSRDYSSTERLISQVSSSDSNMSNAEDEMDLLGNVQRPKMHNKMQERILQRSVVQSVAELEYLMQEMLAAQCYGWAIVIATIIFKFTIIAAILKDYPSFRKPYTTMLKSRTCGGYDDLCSWVEDEFKRDKATSQRRK
mmetsp:Transcript_21698/g.24218  ORF Transcript_21698/g.24218 Transcript_21698/m.24218 type:complete len:215 (-) Transcript_21698:15-659(-)